MPDLTVLGIETSCDETAAALVRRNGDGTGVILSNIVRSQIDEHRAYGGVVPEIAARAHVESLDRLIALAFEEAGLGLDDVQGIAATAGPGLIGGLLIGLTTAKALAFARSLPLLAVNHLEGHALTPGLTDGLKPPYLLLLVSGGHTQILVVRDVGNYRRLGTTLDDALGEAFDKTAKLLGLDYPGGPEVERAAKMGDPTRFALPRPMVGRAEPHFSLAGLKTAIRLRANELINATGALSDSDIADLCASFEAAVAEMVEDRVATAMRIYEAGFAANFDSNCTIAAPRHLVVTGGVAANATLRAKLVALCRKTGYSLHLPPHALCTDNAAMIAWAGAERLARGEADALEVSARARWPLDGDASSMIGSGQKGAKA